MDLLSQHEAFLRAIFDAPDDDTPRLVYADFLEENGEPARAEIIRWQCDPTGRTAPQASDEVWGHHERGFRAPWKTITLRLDRLRDPVGFRKSAVAECPECFAVEGVKLWGGRISSAEPFDSLFSLAAFARMAELSLEGEEHTATVPRSRPDYSVLPDYGREVPPDYVLKPVITIPGVEALAHHRGARRITSLDLRNNNLDNDAARALVKSPFLGNLKRLQLLEGNRLRGRVWQQVIERFGEDVVG